MPRSRRRSTSTRSKVSQLRAALCAALLVGLPGCDARASDGPDARTQEASDLPVLTGRVVDGANLLSASTEEALTNKLAALERRRSDQVVVVTLPSLNGKKIEQVGLSLGRGWRIGQKDKGNGVLLIVAPNERRVRIEVGYGLEPAIEDDEAARMIEDVMLPAFRTGALETGIVAGTHAIIAELDRSPLVEAKP